MPKQLKRKLIINQGSIESLEEARRRDALALAELIYDIYQEEKLRKANQDTEGLK